MTMFQKELDQLKELNRKFSSKSELKKTKKIPRVTMKELVHASSERKPPTMAMFQKELDQLELSNLKELNRKFSSKSELKKTNQPTVAEHLRYLNLQQKILDSKKYLTSEDVQMAGTIAGRKHAISEGRYPFPWTREDFDVANSVTNRLERLHKVGRWGNEPMLPK